MRTRCNARDYGRCRKAVAEQCHVYSESRPELIRVPLIVWNCVFPCWVGVSKQPGQAAGVLGAAH